MRVVHRKFDFTRLAESALLDDFEVVTDGLQHADASDTSSLTSSSSSSHGAIAAAAAAAAAGGGTRDQGSHVSTTTTQRRGVALLEPISKHLYVFSLNAKTRRRKQSWSYDTHTHVGSAFDNRVTLTFDLLTSMSMHAK